MQLSRVEGLSGYPVFPGDGPVLFRFVRIEEGASFEGVLFVRAGSLASVDQPDDDSAGAALRTAVEQFLATHGREDDGDQTYIPISHKGWTVQKGRE